jgi:hypothetical protein
MALAPDHEVLAAYLDAIRLLTAAVHDDRRTKADLVRLSDRVLEEQKVGTGRGRGVCVGGGGGAAWGLHSALRCCALDSCGSCMRPMTRGIYLTSAGCVGPTCACSV